MADIGQVLMILCSTLTAVYGLIFAFALNKIRKFPITLEEVAPDTKVTLSPSQEAQVKDKAKKEKIAAGVITLIFIIFLLLSLGAPDLMSWSLVTVDKDSDTYKYLQIAALISVCWSWLIELWCMSAFKYRINYLTSYYSIPVGSRPYRSVDKELDVLCRGPYRFFRDPMSVAFRYLAAAVVLSGQSWFLGLLFFLIGIGNEVLVIEMDGKWARFFLGEAFEQYMNGTGGQCLCTCFNGIERKMRTTIEQKFAKLAELDGFVSSSSLPSSAPVIYIGRGSGAPTENTIKHQQSSYGSVNVNIRDSNSGQ